LTQVSYNDNNAQIACIVSSPYGSTTSHAATLTVIRDTTPPTVTNVVADFTYTNVFVSFSQPVSDTATNASNYQSNQGVAVSSVSRVNASKVALATSQMPQGSTLTLTINGVQDMAATPNTIAANTQVTFQSFVYLNGTILCKEYDNCNAGYSLANFLADPRYPNNPDRVDLGGGYRQFGLRQYCVLSVADRAAGELDLGQRSWRDHCVPGDVTPGFGGQRQTVPGYRHHGAHYGNQHRRHRDRGG